MGGAPSQDTTVTCPHCRREFDAPLLGDGAQRGFKCPHCRLFVPLDRVDDELLDAAG